jgi:secretion/DNA translocation related TadE-like protein
MWFASRGPLSLDDVAGTEQGSISVVAVGMIASVVALTGSIVGISGALVVKQRLTGAADAAAIAAADTATGAVPGYPCARADAVAKINGATLIDCALDGPIASVGVSAPFLTFELRARARAGPPEGATGSVEDRLEVAVFDRTRPAFARVVGGELDAAAPRVEVGLAARPGPDLDSRTRVTRLEELFRDGLAFERTIGQFRGVGPH